MARLGLGALTTAASDTDGLRPVNLHSDLRPLADLIELAFADSMDSAGHSAIREMRYLSHRGAALRLITRFNSLAEGISLGFVYMAAGELVGNVSIYPANFPRELGETWLLANVAVHPRHQRRGIAHQLVASSIEALRARGASRVILQADTANEAALSLYEAVGFRYERAWIHWRRSSRARAATPPRHDFHITRLRRNEGAAEFALAQAARPNSRGGLGWLKPLRHGDFCPSLWRRAQQWLSMNSAEKLIIRSAADREILASCWLENAPIGFGRVQARMFASPQIDHRAYAQALLNNLVSRYERATILVEHPRDDEVVSDLLRQQQFKARRELWHMRLDF
ncbi:MAG: GNAT family N-acetyltransferase [Chloroflexi bacterium]|nr:GNAT family N-acetyltransferase [Chloroflexota bacterium]MCY4247882.1 GNAT family N-acetyltransferase [Chloroflexota bacterium]